MTAPRTIVIAWTEPVMVHDGQPFAADLGERPTMIERAEPRACVWLNQGTDDDLAKARAYARSEGYTVYTFKADTRDPLTRARRQIKRKASR